MAKDCSFDVVSEFDKQELVNAIDQVKRDITSRFDLKNSNSDVVLEEHLNSEQYGVGFKLGNDELRDIIDKDLKVLTEDGTVSELAEKYGMKFM